MKFTIPQSDLYNSLQKIISVIPSKTTIPILTNILFELKENTLKLTGTDLEVSIITSLDVVGETDGTAAFPAKKMFDLVRELPDTPLELEIDHANRLQIKAEKGQYKISGESSEEYPHIAIEDVTQQFTYSAPRLLDFVEKTRFAVSVDELRPTLMGVLFQIRPNELLLAATDGHRLVKIVDRKFTYDGDVVQVIIPIKALGLLGRNFEQAEEIKINVSKDNVNFQSGPTTIYTKVISGHYPSYERVIPSDNELKMIAERDLVSACLRRAMVFSNQHTRQIKWLTEPNSLTIVADDMEMGGESKETLAVEYNGDKLEIGYNASYILEILRHLGTEQILFKLKDEGSAVVIEPIPQQEDVDLMMLLMPIRLND